MCFCTTCMSKLSCKFNLFWPNGSWEEDFENALPIFTHVHVKTVSLSVVAPDSLGAIL
jgi:hypothetical protein